MWCVVCYMMKLGYYALRLVLSCDLELIEYCVQMWFFSMISFHMSNHWSWLVYFRLESSAASLGDASSVTPSFIEVCAMPFRLLINFTCKELRLIFPSFCISYLPYIERESIYRKGNASAWTCWQGNHRSANCRNWYRSWQKIQRTSRWGSIAWGSNVWSVLLYIWRSWAIGGQLLSMYLLYIHTP